MTRPDDPEVLEQLLPFYANGTLSLGERARIEAALAASRELREQLTEVEALSMHVKQGGEAMMAGVGDIEERLERISERLDDPLPEAPEEGETDAIAPPPRLGDLLSYLHPARWHPAVSLALALALLAQTAFILSQRGEQSYQTASGDDEQPSNTAPRLIVRLEPQATWQDVEALLSAQSLALIAGPDEGRLTVRLDDPGADADQVLAALRASPAVAFADRLK